MCFMEREEIENSSNKEMIRRWKFYLTLFHKHSIILKYAVPYKYVQLLCADQKM